MLYKFFAGRALTTLIFISVHTAGMSGEPLVDDAKFAEALQRVLDREKHDLSAIVGGMNVASGTDLPLVSPVDSTIIFGTLQEPEKGTATYAAETAAKAFETWSKTSQEERSRILRFVVNAMGTRRYDLAAEIVLSTGFTRREAMLEVDRFVEIIRQAADDAASIKVEWSRRTNQLRPIQPTTS